MMRYWQLKYLLVISNPHQYQPTCPSVSWPLGGTLACCPSLPPTPLLDPVGDLGKQGCSWSLLSSPQSLDPRSFHYHDNHENPHRHGKIHIHHNHHRHHLTPLILVLARVTDITIIILIIVTSRPWSSIPSSWNCCCSQSWRGGLDFQPDSDSESDLSNIQNDSLSKILFR